LDQIKPVAVEEWLDSMKRAKGTKAKIRNLMSALFHHAMRYEWIDHNPIKLVRQCAKREKLPDVLELEELQLLLSKLSLRERTLVLLDAATRPSREQTVCASLDGRRFREPEIKVTRSIWYR